MEYSVYFTTAELAQVIDWMITGVDADGGFKPGLPLGMSSANRDRRWHNMDFMTAAYRQAMKSADGRTGTHDRRAMEAWLDQLNVSDGIPAPFLHSWRWDGGRSFYCSLERGHSNILYRPLAAP